MAQWLRRPTPTAEGPVSVPGWGIKILHVVPQGQKKKIINKEWGNQRGKVTWKSDKANQCKWHPWAKPVTSAKLACSPALTFFLIGMLPPEDTQAPHSPSPFKTSVRKGLHTRSYQRGEDWGTMLGIFTSIILFTTPNHPPWKMLAFATFYRWEDTAFKVI